jgi:DNA-binding response OmpR family regulator
MIKALIIEDDRIFGEMLSLYLSGEGFEVMHVETAQEAQPAVFQFMPDVILLDLLLPDADGADLCLSLREQTQVPIIVVSMKTNVNEKIHVLTAGADDFLSKPFSMQELKARIHTILRRMQPSYSSAVSAVGTLERIQVDPERRMLIVDGKPIEIAYSGFEMMKLFCQHPGKVFSREELINSLRGIDSFINERAIDVHITNLRKKIELIPKEPRHIRTVWGVGYKFIP